MAEFGRNETKVEATERLRANQYRGGRGYTKYSFTVVDIARITGRAIGTIRNDVCLRKLRMEDLESVVEYILGARKV